MKTLCLRRGLLGIAFALALSGLAAHATTFSADDMGINIDTGKMGKFLMAYPVLFDENGATIHKQLEAKPSEKTTVVTYEGGGSVLINMSRADQIDFTFKDLPADVSTWKVAMSLDASFAQGGKWQFDSGAETPFPPKQTADANLYQGGATTATFTNSDGLALLLLIPDDCYVQLLDGRVWNSSNFSFSLSTHYRRDIETSTVTIKVLGDASPAANK